MWPNQVSLKPPKTNIFPAPTPLIQRRLDLDFLWRWDEEHFECIMWPAAKPASINSDISFSSLLTRASQCFEGWIIQKFSRQDCCSLPREQLAHNNVKSLCQKFSDAANSQQIHLQLETLSGLPWLGISWRTRVCRFFENCFVSCVCQFCSATFPWLEAFETLANIVLTIKVASGLLSEGWTWQMLNHLKVCFENLWPQNFPESLIFKKGQEEEGGRWQCTFAPTFLCSRLAAPMMGTNAVDAVNTTQMPPPLMSFACCPSSAVAAHLAAWPMRHLNELPRVRNPQTGITWELGFVHRIGARYGHVLQIRTDMICLPRIGTRVQYAKLAPRC